MNHLKHITSIARKQAYLLLLLVVPALLLRGVAFGSAIAVGGLISILPCWLFGKIFFSASRKLAPRQIVKRLYYAEIVKLLTFTVLLLCAMAWQSTESKTFIISFLLLQSVYWAYCVLHLRGRSEEKGNIVA